MYDISKNLKTIKKHRKNILKIILNGNLLNGECISELDNYIKRYKIKLHELNSNDFDIIIAIIRTLNPYDNMNDNNLYNIINFIIQHCQYQNFNFSITTKNNDIEVPLFVAIDTNQFHIANLLIEKGADINYIVERPNNENINIIQFLCHMQKIYYGDGVYSYNQYPNLTKEMLNYISEKNVNISKCLLDTLTAFIDDNINLKKFFKQYIYKNDFILLLLSMYKNNKKISKKKFNNIINTERNKLKLDVLIYKMENGFYINDLLDNDTDKPESIFNKILKSGILERKLFYWFNFNETFRKIIRLNSFDIRK
eukprot:jgi/Orpsp1_1/1180256/evm.model.c7180000072686.1